MQKKFDYTFQEIINALKEVGLCHGDNLFIHSNLGFFGILKDATNSDDYCEFFKRAIFNVIGNNGTIIVPSFSYSYCNNEIFDKNNTPGLQSIFSEYIRKHKLALRSDDANFSISAIGKNALFYTEGSSVYSFGKNSFWEKFLQTEGKICNFNLDCGSTFIHYVEKQLNVPYRYDKRFDGISIVNSKQVKSFFYHYVYDLEKKNNSPDFSKFHKKAKDSGLCKISNLGKGQIICISAIDVLELIKSEISNDPSFLIKGEI